MVELLIGQRGQRAKRRVDPAPVAEPFNVGEYVCSRVLPGAADTVMDTLDPQTGEEALDRGAFVPRADALLAGSYSPILEQ